MRQLIRFETLKLTLPSGRIFGWALASLLILAITGEIVLRIESVQSLLLPPSYGSSSVEFGIKLAKINSFVKQEGGVDCIFIGSSITDADVDPDVFRAAYKQYAQRDIACFNFSLAGLPPSSARMVAKYLVQTYQPKTIVYGVSAGEFLKIFNQRETYSTSWLYYSLGVFSLEGWLYANSYVYRYVPTLRYFYESDYRTLADAFSKRISSSGFDRSTVIAQIAIESPVSRDDYQMDAESFSGYRELVDLNSVSTRIVIVESPVHPSYFPHYVKGGKEMYESLFIEPISGYARSRGVPVWRTQSVLDAALPPQGWSDPTHLNVEGAKVFSEWLAKQYASLTP
ncbi:MAG: hypothetical protein AABZ78_07110 [Chloroflexota bacterium]